MEPANQCPCSPALLRLLQEAADAGTTDAATLAARLCVSKHTVRTEWQRVLYALEVRCRHAAVMVALQRGWISLPPPLRRPRRRYARCGPGMSKKPPGTGENVCNCIYRGTVPRPYSVAVVQTAKAESAAGMGTFGKGRSAMRLVSHFALAKLGAPLVLTAATLAAVSFCSPARAAEATITDFTAVKMYVMVQGHLQYDHDDVSMGFNANWSTQNYSCLATIFECALNSATLGKQVWRGEYGTSPVDNSSGVCQDLPQARYQYSVRVGYNGYDPTIPRTVAAADTKYKSPQ